MKRRDFLAAAAIPVLPAPAKPWVGVDMGGADSSVIWSVSPDESLFANIAVSGFSNIDQKDDEWGIGVPALESGRQLVYTEDVLRALDGIVWAVKVKYCKDCKHWPARISRQVRKRCEDVRAEARRCGDSTKVLVAQSAQGVVR